MGGDIVDIINYSKVKKLEEKVNTNKAEVATFKEDYTNLNDVFLKVTENINFVKGNNYFANPLEIHPNEFITSTGYITSTIYTAYVFRLKAGTYTKSGKTRHIHAYDKYEDIGTSIYTSISNVSSSGTVTFTQAKDFYLIMNMFNDSTPYILQSGSGIVDIINDNSDIDSLKTDVNILKSAVVVEYKDINLSVSNNTYKITSEFDNENDIVITTNINDTYTNGVFEFNKVDLKNKQGILTPIITNNIDDITPIRVSTGTVGANHGHGCFTCNKNGQTQSDVGSVWTDGVNNYVLVKVDNTKVTFMYPYTETDGIVSVNSIAPTSNLNHVSGATNIGVVSIVGIATGQQLFPSINNHSISFYYDDKEILEDGIYLCDKFTVREKYNVMGYKDIQEFLKLNIGSYSNDKNITGIVQMAINYTFAKGGKCVISHSLKVLQKTQFQECGFIQASALPSTNGTLYRYVPNVNAIGLWDFKSLQDITNLATSIYIKNSNLTNKAIPINRYADIIKDGLGSIIYGFTMGYIPDKTNGKNVERISNPAYWDMRSTKKSYPVAIADGTILEAGDYKTFMAYRNYFPNIGNETCFTYVENGNDTYVFIDYHTNINTNIELESKYMGKNITVLESENFTLLNDTVDVNGISFVITNNYGSAVLKLN